MELKIIKYTDNTGKQSIVDITDDLAKWIVDNNANRDEPEELIAFEIDTITAKIYNL